MADNLLAYPISSQGGLDETATSRELQSKPGWASVLYNFEVSTDGGYRRVNGYTKLGKLGKTPDLTPSEILGITTHSEGFVIAKATNIYYTEDGNDYVQLNKVNALTEIDEATIKANAVDPRPDDVGHYNFESFSKGTTSTLIGVASNSSPVHITVNKADLSNTMYSYKTLGLTQGSLDGADQLVKYKDQLVISGMDTAPTEIYYSDILKPHDFEGANAGSIGMNDIVTGLKMFRDVLYVFCRNSIHAVRGLETGSPQRTTVTSQLGCVSGNSIQEIAGDLAFLGPDGLRTLSATTRISDIDISTMSQTVQGRLRRAIQDINEYYISTTVIRNKSQYRIFFRPKDPSRPVKSLSLVMFIGRGTEGQVFPQFSEIGGFDIAAIHSGYMDNVEIVVSGDSNGNIYYHDKGPTFDGLTINFAYETPFFDMGDSTIRKTLHKIITRINPEGLTNFNMRIVFDNEAQWTYSPPSYPMTPINAPPLYGSSIYGEARYGASQYPIIETLTEGSGKVVSLRIFPSGLDCDPFTIQGYDIYFLPAGKL